jgi:hypothetical protein
MSSWFSTGEEAERQVDSDAQERSRRQSNQVRRYWLPPGAENLITFVDGFKHPSGYPLPFVYLEHQLYLGGHWRNWFTCPSRMVDEDGDKVICPICEGGDSPYLAGAYTVIDHNEWTDKSGVNHKDELRLYIVKGKVLRALKKKAAKKKGLRGWLVEVSRGDQYSPNTGDSFDFEKRTTMSDDIQPFDYREVLKPSSVGELRKVIGGVSIEDEDEIPF